MSQLHVPTVSRPASGNPALAGGVFHAVRHMAGAAVEALLIWQERAAERAHLAALDDRMLRDIGLSRADADHEASKPFWRS